MGDTSTLGNITGTGGRKLKATSGARGHSPSRRRRKRSLPAPLRPSAPRQGPTRLSARSVRCPLPRDGAGATHQGRDNSLTGTGRPVQPFPPRSFSRGETTSATLPQPLPAARPALLRPTPLRPRPRPIALTNPRRAPLRSAPPHWWSALNPWAEETEWAWRRQGV